MDQFEFKVGDIVEFELSNIIDTPRWDYYRDNGGSGIWTIATVDKLTYYNNVPSFEIQWFNSAQELCHWLWPQYSHISALYYGNAEGYLKKFKQINLKYETKCDCGCDKVYGKDNKFHSDWCSKKVLFSS